MEQVVGIVEADQEHLSPVHEGVPDLVHDPPERDPTRRREVSEDRLVNPGVDHEPGVVVLAVYIDRQDPLRGLTDLAEDVPDAGRLPGPGETAKDQVRGPGPEECGPDRVGHLLELGIPVLEKNI